MLLLLWLLPEVLGYGKFTLILMKFYPDRRPESMISQLKRVLCMLCEKAGMIFCLRIDGICLFVVVLPLRNIYLFITMTRSCVFRTKAWVCISHYGTRVPHYD